MARRATTKDPEPQTTALTTWDEELAREAEAAAAMEANAGGGQFFSIRGGILSLNDVPMPDNQMAVVVLDSIIENVFYEGDYDPNNVTPPTCFAFGRDEPKLAPHKAVVEKGQAQHETCRGCPMNEWGSADKGRGKACSNRRRLALLSAGELLPSGQLKGGLYDLDHFETSPPALMKLPVTSVKGYANYVKQLAGALKKPPFAVATLIRVVPDQKSQFKVTFSPLEKLPDALVQAAMTRRKEVAPLLEQPYNLDVEKVPPPPRGRSAKPGARPPVKKKY